MKFLKFPVLLLLSAVVWTIPAKAQARDEAFSAAGISKLMGIDLPAGAQQVRNDQIPSQIKSTLAALVAKGGPEFQPGATEVFLWLEDYDQARGAQLIRALEKTLKNSGWQYQVIEKTGEVTMFTVHRTAPERRALAGFFRPSDEGFVFAAAEILKVVARRSGDRSTTDQPEVQPATGRLSDPKLFGRWHRSIGGGTIDETNKTQYQSGEDFTFEFYPDGSVAYTRKKEVLSIMQCRIEEIDQARGRFSVSGNTLKIDLGKMSSSGSDSCNAKGNFKKTLDPSTLTVTFEIKQLESPTRPDSPTIMCLNGKDDVCFEKVRG